MVVSVVALIFAMAGTSIAAVNFAQNAGAVDGKSAVGATASNAKAAGKLVATGKSGRVPTKFLDLSGIMRGEKATFAGVAPVTDNGTTAPIGLASRAGLATVAATCSDQATKAGDEDPQTTITVLNGSGSAVNYSRSIGAANPGVGLIAPSAQADFTINNSNTFEVYVQQGDAHYVVRGNVRQEAAGSNAANCVVWGYALSL
jgi:hypothetical protein